MGRRNGDFKNALITKYTASNNRLYEIWFLAIQVYVAKPAAGTIIPIFRQAPTVIGNPKR